jgi:hypothetical protein
MAKPSSLTGSLLSEAVPLKLKGLRGSAHDGQISWEEAQRKGLPDEPSSDLTADGVVGRTRVGFVRDAVGLIMKGSTTFRESRTCWTCRENEARRALRTVSRQRPS